jgi:hypothetical protein
VTGAERELVRAARDEEARSHLGYDSLGRLSDHGQLPTVAEARSMTRWVDCPVHGLKVGYDLVGLVGRCSECAGEAARAIRILEAQDV